MDIKDNHVDITNYHMDITYYHMDITCYHMDIPYVSGSHMDIKGYLHECTQHQINGILVGMVQDVYH